MFFFLSEDPCAGSRPEVEIIYNMLMRQRHKKSKRRNAPVSPNAIDTQRYERLLEVLEELAEINLDVPVIVEGKRDKAALRELGLEGEVITINRGIPIDEMCQDIAEDHERVVLLMDWDGTGQSLDRRLRQELSGMWEEHERFGRLLRVLCQKEVRDIEGIPSLVRRLSRNAIPRTEE